MARHLIVNRARPMPRPLAGPGRDPAPGARGDESWYRIRNASGRGGTAEVYIYDEIGYWGVSAQQFVNDLRDLDADVIELHVNSPGGEVYDGIAIYNALLNHPAQVNVTVDALAASAASFIAQAGHTVTMARNAEMMIHDAIGVAWDNADGLRELADRLDAVSDNIAGIYADRAGGTAASWRKTMRAETWYSAAEAVEARLADKVVTVERRGADDATENRWAGRRDAISARFRYVNRGATVAPLATGGIVRSGEIPIVGEQGPELTEREADRFDIGEVFPEAVSWLEREVADEPAGLPVWAAPLDAGQLHRQIGVAAGALPAWNIEPDVFRETIRLITDDAPAPPEPVRPERNSLTRTVPASTDTGFNLHDALREVAG